jgi:4-hydroxy-3-methylbut-2-enyl diphosphate reductase IspH
MKVILAQPRGFCAGVVRAIEIVDRTLEKYGTPIFIQNHRDLSKLVDVIPLIGAKNSSNSNSLQEIGAEDKVRVI